MSNNFFTQKNLIIIGVVVFCIILIGSIFSVIYVKNNIIDNLNFEVVAEKSTDFGIETENNFIITSEKNYSARTLKKVIALNPSIDFSLDKVDSNTYVLTPSDKLKDDSIYNVYISIDGEKIDKSWAFQTKADFKVVSTLPTSNVSNVNKNTAIVMNFSKPITNIDGFFEISPKVSGNFEYREKNVVFKPESLDLDTIYEVTLKKGLKNVYGEELLEDYTFSFRTEYNNYNYFAFVDGYESTFRADEIPDIKISSSEKYHYSEFDINLYKLNNLQEYVNFLEIHHNEVNSEIGEDTDHIFDMSKYSVAYSFKGKVEEYPNSWIEYIKFPDTLETGWYIADARATAWDFHFQKAIQISDVSVYTYGLNGEVKIWCNDTDTGTPLSGATVQVGDLAAITNKDGIASFSLTDSNKQRILITTKEGKEFGEYMSLVDKDESDLVDDYYTYLYTDRERYFPTDTINFWGTIIPKKSTINMPEKVTVKLDEKEIEVKVNENGMFFGKYEISNHTSTWLYVNLELNGKEDYIKGIEIVDYIKPVYKITSNFDKEYYRGTEPINLNVYGKFYDGTSAENLQLKVSYNGKKNKTVTLDSNGEGKVRIDYNSSTKDGDYGYAYANIEVAGIDEYASSYNSVPYFPTDYSIRTDWDSQDEKLKLKTNKYNYDAIENGVLNYYKLYEGESFDQKVYIDIYELESVKTKVGESYNAYTGLLEPKYKYDHVENIISNIEVNIGKDKEEFLDLASIARRDNCTYEARISFVLPDGYAGQKIVQLFKYSNFNSNSDNYYFRRDDNYKALKMGESTTLMFTGKELPQNFRMIYFVSTDKVNTMGVTTSNSVKVTMAKDLVPNCLVNAAVFDGKRLQEIGTEYLMYDTSEKELDIEILTDKDVYKPGDTVRVNILVKDSTGAPVKTEMVVSAVNEATYENEYYDTPISLLYKERYHYPKTFISNYYQNFEGGDGGGGGEEAREKFVDVLLFKPITTNENGKATVEFTTSDDLTSWRITAVAVSKDVKGGIKTKNVSASIPFFINQVINEKYTVNDDVVFSLRAAGNATKLISSNVKYEAKIEGKDSKELVLQPSKTAMFNFGKLPIGKYKVSVKAESGEYSDAINKEIEVVESNSELSIVKIVDISELSSIEALKYPIKLMFFDKDNGLAYKSLKKVIEQSNGGTNEQIFAKNSAYELLNEFYGKEVYSVDSKVILQNYTGGISKFSYTSEDPLITANICMINADKIDNKKAIEYFYRIVNASDSMPNDVTASYMGLAALKQPVLNDIKYLLNSDNGLELIDKINLISALAYIGDYASAQKYYEKSIEGIMTADKEYKYIGSDYETAVYKANSRLLTTLALTNHVDFKNVLNYVLDNSADDYISALDLLVAINNYMPIKDTKSWMEYELNGETIKVNFADKRLEVLTLDENEMKTFSVKRSNGDIEVMVEYVGGVSEISNISDKVKIKKTVTSGKLGDYSDVTLEVFVLDDKEEYYLITDFIPLSSRYAKAESSYNGGYYYMGYENQKINFNINSKKHKNWTIKYKIRNVFSGEFLMESAFATDSNGMIVGKSNDLKFNVE